MHRLFSAYALVFVFIGTQSCAATLIEHKSIKVIVLDYDPILRTKGGVRLHEYMKWSDPRLHTVSIVKHLREASGGFADYKVVEFIEVDAFPEKRDGFNYTEQTFLEMWANRDKAHQPDTVSYAAIFRKFNLVERIKKEGIQEIWLWGAPYFGTDEYAMKIPGDLIYFPTDNPWFYRPYDIPECGKTVWVMGWNYERGEAEALHSYGHRCEGILSLTVGKGIWDNKKTPNNIWNRFTHLAMDFPDDAQVGNVHGGPNAKGGYDYAQKETVMSAADDWLKYPRLTGAKKPVNAETWGGPDYHLNYMRWWLNHLPRVPGRTDGFHNNWWQYVANYDEAVRKMPPPGGKAAIANNAMR
jgi:hypothetical protein